MNSEDLLKIQGDMDKASSPTAMRQVASAPNAGGGIKLNPMELLRMICRYWYAFVIILAIALTIAYVKLHSTSPVYTRTASVLIKSGKNNGRLGSESQVFQEVGVLNTSANVDNELLIFKSERLSQLVVERLNLQTVYLYKNGLMQEDLYAKSPVTVRWMEEKPETGNFQVTLLVGKKVKLEHFSGDEKMVVEGILGQTLNTPMGKLQIHPTLFYNQSWTDKALTVVQGDARMIARGYSGRLVAASAQKGAAVVNLTLNDVSAQRAEDFLNTLIDVYNEDVIRDKNQMLLNTDQFIKDRLEILERDLGGVEDKLASFKQQNKMINLESEAGIAVGGATQYQQEGYGLENQLQLVQMIRDYLVDPTHATELIPSNTGVSDVNIESQITEYNRLLLERDKLLKSSGAENPAVAELNETLELTRQAMVRSVDNAIASLKIRIKNTESLERSMSQRMAAVPQHEKYMLNVERQQKVKEQLYVYLLQKREENALAQSITESNARLIEAPKGPLGPISPIAMQYYLIALVVGIGLPLAVVVMMLLLDTKVHNRKDIEDHTAIPFLGDIPFCKERYQGPLAVRPDGKDPVTEAFRILRTNLNFMIHADQSAKVLMNTSMNPDAGKTFIISNLSAMMAYAGKKVLMIDLDIRKGALTRLFGGRRKPGVTHYLAGQTDDVRALIHAVPECPGLDIIYSGVVPPNPAELLLSHRLDELVAAVKEDYDYVFLDNVPVAVVADATIVNRLADATVFIGRAGVLDRRQLPDIERIYQEGKLKQMALVLNGVKEEHAGYGRYGYYGYGYGYGYGYHDKKKKKKKIFGWF